MNFPFSMKRNSVSVWRLNIMLKIILRLLLLSCLASLLLAIRIHCNHPERIREDHIHYCCKHPDGHNDITEKCARETGFKLPAPNEEAVEDVTVEQVVHGMCWGKCVFQQYRFLNRKHELDMDAVRRHYQLVHKHDPEYEREMIAAFDHCHGKSEKATAAFIQKLSDIGSGKQCDPKPSVILACVIHYFFHNCPKSRWANTQECSDTLAFARRCKDALVTM